MSPRSELATLERFGRAAESVCANPVHDRGVETVMFHPWKGDYWGRADNAIGGVRLLILGESHYCNPANAHLVGQCVPSTTEEVVHELAIEGRHRFFTGLTQIVAGRPKWQMTAAEVRAVWDSIVFYNYVPVFVATGPRVRPSGAMFESGHAPFAELLTDLKPEALIVCGRDLWWWMRRGFFDGVTRPPAIDVCQIGGSIAARIIHPSANRFSSNRTRPIIERLLAEALAVR